MKNKPPPPSEYVKRHGHQAWGPTINLSDYVCDATSCTIMRCKVHKWRTVSVCHGREFLRCDRCNLVKGVRLNG